MTSCHPRLRCFLLNGIFSCNEFPSLKDINSGVFQVEKEIGEKRVIAFRGAGLSIAPGFNFSDVTASSKDPEEVRPFSTPMHINSSIHGCLLLDNDDDDTNHLSIGFLENLVWGRAYMVSVVCWYTSKYYLFKSFHPY